MDCVSRSLATPHGLWMTSKQSRSWLLGSTCAFCSQCGRLLWNSVAFASDTVRSARRP